jgi:hypothetical protein
MKSPCCLCLPRTCCLYIAYFIGLDVQVFTKNERHIHIPTTVNNVGKHLSAYFVKYSPYREMTQMKVVDIHKL